MVGVCRECFLKYSEGRVVVNSQVDDLSQGKINVVYIILLLKESKLLSQSLLSLSKLTNIKLTV
jgi:hypothetical protein